MGSDESRLHFPFSGLGPGGRRQACTEVGRVLLLSSRCSLQKHAFDRDVLGLFLIVVLGEGRQEKWRGPIGRLHFLREVREEAIRCQRGRSKGAREELLECSWV